MNDPTVFQAAQNVKAISIALHHNKVAIDERSFHFDLSETEKQLFKRGRIASALKRFGHTLFEAMTTCGASGSMERERAL